MCSVNITVRRLAELPPFELADVRANVNQHVCIIRPKPEALFTRYVIHFI